MALQETLELDVAEALRGVDRVDDALTQAASGFKVALADALDVLRTPTDVAINDAGLTSQIEQAVAGADAVADVTLTGLDAAQAEVTSAIDAGVADADTAVTVTAEGLDAVTSEVTDAVDTADATVVVEADVEAAAAEIADLGATADVSSSALEGIATSTRALDVAAGLAAGELSGLKDALPDESNLAGVAAALGAVAIGATQAFHAADEAEVAEDRLKNTFGALSEEVQDIDVGGLTGDLTHLAEAAGSSDEALKLSIARLAELGQSTGASDEKIVRVSQDIAALALRLSVVNPTLGDAGDIAERLGAAFARGGRALYPFGLAINSTEINARALRDTGKSTAEELTLFDKSAAGAAIATERLGDSLGPDFQRGTQQTVIGLRSLKEEFGNALEEIGKPLLGPVLQELREGEKPLEELASLFAEVAVEVLPLAASLIGVAAPALHTTLDAVEVLLPVVDGLVTLVGKVPAPVLAAVGVFLALHKASSLLSPAVAKVGEALAGAAYQAALGGSALGGVGASLAGLLNPLTLTIAGVAALVAVVSAHNAAQAKERAEVRKFTEEIEKQTDSFSDLTEEKLRDLTVSRRQSDDLVRVGLTTQRVTQLALEGKDGLDAFLDALVRSGEVSDLFASILKGAAGAGDNLVNMLNDPAFKVQPGAGLIKTFVEVQRTASAAARSTLDDAVAQGRLTKEQVEAEVSQHRLIDGGTDYVTILNDLLPVQVKAADGTAILGTHAEQAAQQIRQYGEILRDITEGSSAYDTAAHKIGPSIGLVAAAFVEGSLGPEDFRRILARTNVTADELKGALEQVQGEVDDLAGAFVENLPKITGASADLEKDKSLDQFLADLHKKTIDAATFIENLVTLERRGATSIADALREAGPAAASQAAAAAKLGDEALAKKEAQRRADIALNDKALADQRDFGEKFASQQVANKHKAEAAGAPDLTKPLRTELGRAEKALDEARAFFERAGEFLGEAIGTGLDVSRPEIFRAAERAGRAAKAGFAKELQISSPSKVFLDYGVNVGSSFVSGVDSTAAEVDAAAVRLARRMVLNLPGAGVPTVNAGAQPVPGAVAGGGGNHIVINEVANDPIATAFAVDKMLGSAAAR